MDQRNALLFFGIFGGVGIIILIIVFVSSHSSGNATAPSLPQQTSPAAPNSFFGNLFPVFPSNEGTAGNADPAAGSDSTQNPFAVAPTTPGSETSAGSKQDTSRQSPSTPPPPANQGTQPATPATVQGQVVPNPTESQDSDLKGKIYFSYFQLGYNGDADQEYVVIQASTNNTDKVLISGLTLKSFMTGNMATIGNGVYLPFAGVVNATAPIYLAPGENAVVVTGTSPVGFSFKLNECIGYYAQFQNFVPSLPTECPAIRNEGLPPPPNALDDYCLDYIDSYPICTYQTVDPAYLSQACNDYIRNKGNYSYCVNAHKNETTFYQPGWRVFLGRDQTLWKNEREIIQLLDSKNKLIATYTY